MKPVFIASTPNSQIDDRKICWKILFRPLKWKIGVEQNEVRKQLCNYLNLKFCFTYDTGRASLYSIFKALKLKPNSEIIIQSFTCLAVPLSIKWAKAKPVYIDINPKTFNPDPLKIKKSITPQTRIVIVQHTFGIPTKVDEVKMIIDKENKKRAKDTKIYLIEDLAHSLGVEYKGKKLGRWGDIAMLSFGQDKAISCTQGGAVLTNNKEVAEELNKEYKKLKALNSFSIFKNIIHPPLWNIINKMYYFPPKISLGKGLILLFRLLGLLKNQADPSKVDIHKPEINRLSNAQSIMLKNQIKKLDTFINHRKEITKTYEDKLKLGFKGLALLRYPIVSKDCSKIIKKLKKNRITPGNWYNNPIHPIDTDLNLYEYKKGSCPNTEKISPQILNLPTHINTTLIQAKHISTFL